MALKESLESVNTRRPIPTGSYEVLTSNLRPGMQTMYPSRQLMYPPQQLYGKLISGQT